MQFHLNLPKLCWECLVCFSSYTLLRHKHSWRSRLNYTVLCICRAVGVGDPLRVFPKSPKPVLEKAIFPLVLAAVCRGQAGCSPCLLGLLLSTASSTINQIRDQVM